MKKSPYTVLITDEKHPYYNQRLEVFYVLNYLPYKGKRLDLYLVKNPEGDEFRILSDQIDIEDYNSQKLKKQIERLGAKVNDVVMISRIESDSFLYGFDLAQPHLITEILPSGLVVFDNGYALCFQPDVIKYTGNNPVQTDFTKPIINKGLPF